MKFLRFRTGCHSLPNVTSGWEGVPRSQPLCPLCQSQYCDERHALLECPALVSLREKYHQLFCVHNSMRQFLWQNNMLLLVRYVIKCLDSFAAACDHLDRFVMWRALSGCYVSTSLVACPGSSIARELIPLGGGIGGDTAAILLGLKLYNSFPFLHQYITLMGGSHHLISQAGWNRCNLSIYLS